MIQLLNMTSLNSKIKTYDNEVSMLIEEDPSEFIEIDDIKVAISSYTSKLK